MFGSFHKGCAWKGVDAFEKGPTPVAWFSNTDGKGGKEAKGDAAELALGDPEPQDSGGLRSSVECKLLSCRFQS